MEGAVLGVLAAVLMQAATTEPPPPHVSVLTMPDWKKKPNARDMERYFPKDAARLQIEGRAAIQCRVEATGLLSNCNVEQEWPIGAGFGQAAVGLSATFKMLPQTKDGAPVAGGRIRIPINFRLPHAVPLPPGTTSVMLAPEWTRAPTGAEIMAAFPPKAKEARVEGDAMLRCVISPVGDLSDCAAISESPADRGFAAAALTLAPSFRTPIATVDGRYVAGAVVFAPVRFDLPR